MKILQRISRFFFGGVAPVLGRNQAVKLLLVEANRQANADLDKMVRGEK